jgi:hypothetical protein
VREFQIPNKYFIILHLTRNSEDVIAFQNRYRELRGKAYTWPLWLANFKLDEGEAEAEGMAYVALSVFEERTGQNLPSEFLENHHIDGMEWKEEGDDLARMFPKLWKKYNGA